MDNMNMTYNEFRKNIEVLISLYGGLSKETILKLIKLEEKEFETAVIDKYSINVEGIGGTSQERRNLFVEIVTDICVESDFRITQELMYNLTNVLLWQDIKRYNKRELDYLSDRQMEVRQNIESDVEVALTFYNSAGRNLSLPLAKTSAWIKQ